MSQYLGLGGCVLIREIIKLMKPAWSGTKWSGTITVTMAIITGIILNTALSLTNNCSLTEAIGMGIMAGILSAVWNKLIAH